VVNIASTSCAGYVPTYGSIGAYFGLVTPPTVDLASFRADMEAFTLGTYVPAYSTYLALHASPAAPLLDAMSARTGLPPQYWVAQFNLGPDTYQQNLVPGALIGRYDARVWAPLGTLLASEGDPSSTFITPSFAAGIDRYLREELKYSYPSGYVLLSSAIDVWNFSHARSRLPDVLPDLAAAMTLNPRLRVLSLNGYHDLATPYFQTLLDLQRLIDMTDVTFRTYDGGHMTYLDDRSRPLEKADLRGFYRSTGGLP